MEVEYFIDEEMEKNARKGLYTPIKMKIYREGRPGFKNGYPWQKFSSSYDLEKRVKQGYPLYIVIFIEHDGEEQSIRYFFDKEKSLRYVQGLAQAIYQREKVSGVDTHYDSGKKNIFELLKNIPVNTYTSFKTDGSTFSVTLGQI